MQPTKEHKQWLWEQCGFEYLPHLTAWNLRQSDGLLDLYEDAPLIDLNNLFKYAVPKLQLEGYVISLVAMEFAAFRVHFMKVTTGKEWHFEKDEADPTLALFWAIYEVFGGKNADGNRNSQ